MDRETLNKIQREKRKLNGNLHTLRYEKTINGFLMRVYRNMQSRVTGVQYKKSHLYLGKSLLPREDFYHWAKNSEAFTQMFKRWQDSCYRRALTPSINRIDTDIGYELGNIEWMSHSFNSRLGSMASIKANRHVKKAA